MSDHIATLAALTAEEAQANDIGPGLIAFLIVAALGVATFLLIRSMLHHLRKVPPTFEAEEPPDEQGSKQQSGD